MKLITMVFILNATILILHEIESAFEEEWLLFKLPGGMTGFLLFHVPLLLMAFWGVLEIEGSTPVGHILSLVFGLLGLAPFFVHMLFLKVEGSYNKTISLMIIYANVVLGLVLVYISVRGIV